MVTIRRIVGSIGCGHLTGSEYPAQWSPDPFAAYRFHYKREAAIEPRSMPQVQRLT